MDFTVGLCGSPTELQVVEAYAVESAGGREVRAAPFGCLDERAIGGRLAVEEEQPDAATGVGRGGGHALGLVVGPAAVGYGLGLRGDAVLHPCRDADQLGTATARIDQ